MKYVVKAVVKAGVDLWQWQIKGTLVWGTVPTKEEAIRCIAVDAKARGLSKTEIEIEDISVMQPQGEAPWR